ncbi:hypothetical protein [Spirosoma koreense]
MALDDHASNLINITVKAFNGDVTSISPTDGLSLVDSWVSFLDADESGKALVGELRELKAELQSGNLDGASIQQILKNLTAQTKQITDSADRDSQPKLNTLSGALQSFSQQVGGASGPAKTGGQAPMTSTVGGESTHSGVGASTFGASSDELAGRNGGTISNATEPGDMDDTTGSDGGPTKDRSSDEDTGDSSYDNSTESEESRSDTSRVDGMGVSGGTGDTATSQSGGRSQY